MSYIPSASPTPSQQPSKDNRKVIYGILIVLLIGTWGYIIYDKSKTKETIDEQKTQIVTVTGAKDSIQQAFNNASARLDSVSGSNVKLQGALADKNDEILKMKSNIRSILNKKNATASELAEAKKMIDELNGKIDGYVAEIEKLKGENQQLTTQNTQLTTEKQQLATDKDQLQQNLSTTQAEKANIQDVASTLHASNINVEAIKIKSNGKEKETTTAKRADAMKISFDLDENRITPTGSKDIYVCVTGPDGKVISNGTTFTSRDTGDKQYTSKVQVNYEQGKRSSVSFNWQQEGLKYEPGNYKVEIYNNGFKIGEGTKTLKKGGLFS
ncbi:hypothetical protein ACI6Q2_22845 [Chitinophagaceae bacterium LWZ2-11]